MWVLPAQERDAGLKRVAYPLELAEPRTKYAKGDGGDDGRADKKADAVNNADAKYAPERVLARELAVNLLQIADDGVVLVAGEHACIITREIQEVISWVISRATRAVLPIELSDSKLEHRGKAHPRKVRKVGVGNPRRVRPHGPERPHQRAEYQQDVGGREHVAFEPELQRSKSEIKNNIEYKREQHNKRQPPLPVEPPDIPVAGDNNRVQNAPHRPKNPTGRRPRRADKLSVYLRLVHLSIIPS